MAKSVAVGTQRDALGYLFHDRLSPAALVHHRGDGSYLVSQVVEVNRRAVGVAAVGAGQGILVLEEPILCSSCGFPPRRALHFRVCVGHTNVT